MAEKVICIMGKKSAEKVSKIVKTIITNKEDLKGKFTVETIIVNKEDPKGKSTVEAQHWWTKIDGSDILYIVDHDEIVDLENEKLSGKNVILYHGKLDSEVVRIAMDYSAIGVFDVTRFFGKRLEYSEIARFEETVKTYLRKKLKDSLLEKELSKPINWKLKYNQDSPDNTITLFSDSKIRETIMKAKKIAEGLKKYVENIKKLRTSDLNNLLKFELNSKKSESRGIECITKIYNTISENTEKSKIRKIEAVLITGPTGSGKTLIAKQIAKALYGEDFESYFSKITVSNISENLVETELFGSFPGAFTGSSYKLGKILANIGGIVFLDEIGEISPKIQAKLLTYMDDLAIQIEGYSNPCGVKAPVLLIAATNRNLKEEIDKGNFRTDLYHRFQYKVTVPAIAERKTDLRYLISFLLQAKKEERGSGVERISIESIEKLESYAFPGNFRELESIIREAIDSAEFDGRTCILSRDIEL